MTALETLQATLAGEHAAVWVYGTLGGLTSASADPTLYDGLTLAYRTHRGRRDELARMVRDLGVEPVAASVAYQLTNDASTPTRVRAVAREVEQRCGATYADLVAHTFGDQRRWAVSALTDAAVRSLAFGAAPEPFPGLTELRS